MGSLFPFQINFFVCDAPARSFCKGTKLHSGYHSCERCCTKGVQCQNRIVYPNLDCAKRTDGEFAAMSYQGTHQLRHTLLVNRGINCVSQFVLDSMHLVYQGVVKRMLEWWCNPSKLQCRLSNKQRTLVSNTMIRFNGQLPREFARQPRSLKNLARWKATEFREFLHYTGMVALKGVLSKEAYLHFLNLVVAIRLLSDKEFIEKAENVAYSRQLLRYFIIQSGKSDIFGEHFITYNECAWPSIPSG